MLSAAIESLMGIFVSLRYKDYNIASVEGSMLYVGEIENIMDEPSI